MGCPSAPLRRGPDGLEFWLQGTMLKVAPVSTKYLSLVNSSVKKIKPAFAGKCIAVAVACVGKAAAAVRVPGMLPHFWNYDLLLAMSRYIYVSTLYSIYLYSVSIYLHTIVYL
jgi:hypothetical protein